MAIISLARLPKSKTRPKLTFYLRDSEGEILPLEAIPFDVLPDVADRVPTWR